MKTTVIWLNSRLEGPYSTNIIYDHKGLSISIGTAGKSPIILVFDDFYQWEVFCDGKVYSRINELIEKFLQSNGKTFHEIEFISKVTAIVREAVIQHFSNDPDLFTVHIETLKEQCKREGASEERLEVTAFLKRYLP